MPREPILQLLDVLEWQLILSRKVWHNMEVCFASFDDENTTHTDWSIFAVMSKKRILDAFMEGFAVPLSTFGDNFDHVPR